MHRRFDISVAGIPVWVPTRAELVDAFARQLAAPVGSVRPATLFTLNPELILLAVRDPGYRATLASGHWNVIDGIGVAHAVRWRARDALAPGLRARELRHSGADLVYDVALAAERVGRPLLILGGAPDRAHKACASLRRILPRLVIESFSPAHTPRLPFPEQAEIEARLVTLRPCAVVVCLGAPKQETWIKQSLDCLAAADVRIAAGFGGAVDFLSGETPRAPRFMRSLGAEWLFRLAVEPWRFKRQASTLPAFALRSFLSPEFIEVRDRAEGSDPGVRAA